MAKSWTVVDDFERKRNICKKGKNFFLLDNLYLDLTLQCLICIRNIFHRFAERKVFVLALDSSSHSRNTPYVGWTVKKQEKGFPPWERSKCHFWNPFDKYSAVFPGASEKITSLELAASWAPPGYCDPTVLLKGGSHSTVILGRFQKGSQSTQIRF